MKSSLIITDTNTVEIYEPGEIIRHCVTCGLCTSTCPTYILTNDDKDGPRGRNILMREMLESKAPPTDEQVHYLDRCLSCLSCMTTCPSKVDYAHLIDKARSHIEKHYQRPLSARLMRAAVAHTMPYPKRFAVLVALAKLAKPFSFLMPKAMRDLYKLFPSHQHRPKQIADQQSVKSAGTVMMLSGCVQPSLAPEINDATEGLLKLLGFNVVKQKKSACCGALTLHMGNESPAKTQARELINECIWHIESSNLKALIINASGCGTTVKDYAHMFSDDPEMKEKAERVVAIAQDITEFLTQQDFEQPSSQLQQPITVAYHSACSMQHGQKIRRQPLDLLRIAGFDVKTIPDSHICCGSAGTYNIFQKELSEQLLERKIRSINTIKPDVIATGNIGCMLQIGSATGVPVVHTVEMLYWALGGPKPEKLQ